jgi:hypothetical protein
VKLLRISMNLNGRNLSEGMWEIPLGAESSRPFRLMNRNSL